MNLADRRSLRLFTLCALYVAQGVPWGFMSTTIPNYLEHRGLEQGAINAALAFTVLPYSFKWMWGPIIDAFTIPRLGRRRPWILFAQLMMATTVLAMVTIDVAADVELLAWMILIHTVFNALQDVAVDALAVDLLDADERGRANGLMYASKYAGGILGGAGMVTLVEIAGFNTALLAQAGLLVAILALVVVVRERGSATERPPIREVARGLTEAFSVRSALIAAFVALATQFPTGIISATSRGLYITQLGWTYGELTRLSGGWGLVAGGAGAAAGGFLVDLVGRRAMAAIASILLGLGWILFVVAEPWWDVRALGYGFGLYEAACQGLLATSLFALFMDLSLPRVAGSQFAAYTALMNFATTLAYQAATWVNETWEVAGVYALCCVFQLAATGLLVFVDPGETRRVLPRAPGTRASPLGALALGVLALGLVLGTAYAAYLRLR